MKKKSAMASKMVRCTIGTNDTMEWFFLTMIAILGGIQTVCGIYDATTTVYDTPGVCKGVRTYVVIGGLMQSLYVYMIVIVRWCTCIVSCIRGKGNLPAEPTEQHNDVHMATVVKVIWILMVLALDIVTSLCFFGMDQSHAIAFATDDPFLYVGCIASVVDLFVIPLVMAIAIIFESCRRFAPCIPV